MTSRKERLRDRTMGLIYEQKRILIKNKERGYLHCWTNVAAGPDQAQWTRNTSTALEFFSLEWAFAIAPLYDCKVVTRKLK